jgi:hypothetical protein
VFAYVVLRGERPAGAETEKFAKTLRDWVSEQLGAIARPDDIRFANNLPKTRSGKIMRRLLRAIARNEDITQDLSTLENPSIIDQLRGVESDAAATAKPKPGPAVKAKPKAKPKKKAKVKAAKARPSAKRHPVKKPAKQPAKKAAKKLARKPAKKRTPPRRKK